MATEKTCQPQVPEMRANQPGLWGLVRLPSVTAFNYPGHLPSAACSFYPQGRMNTSRKPGSSRLALPKLSRHMGRRPNHDRRLANRKVVDLQAEMGLGFNGTLEPVAVREISEQSLYVLAEQRPRLGSDVQIYLNITHPVSGGSRRVCYTATV